MEVVGIMLLEVGNFWPGTEAVLNLKPIAQRQLAGIALEKFPPEDGICNKSVPFVLGERHLVSDSGLETYIFLDRDLYSETVQPVDGAELKDVATRYPH